MVRKKDEAREIAKTCARIADDKKGENIVVLKMSDLIVLTDYFVIIGASNPRQVRAIADDISRTMKKLKVPCLSNEGLQGATWVLLDYVDVVVHVFDEETRAFYDLERLWADAPRARWRKITRKKTAEEGKTP